MPLPHARGLLPHALRTRAVPAPAAFRARLSLSYRAHGMRLFGCQTLSPGGSAGYWARLGSAVPQIFCATCIFCAPPALFLLRHMPFTEYTLFARMYALAPSGGAYG